MIKWIKDTYRYYNTIIELSRLSDRELEHLGMTRFDIAQVALKEYWRSNAIHSQSFR